ncbi:polyketide cyclase/dehydrase family protein [Desulfocurvibacter africanus PCS]|uniref:Polyketide cyclase/dehydrase family protein n=1 Tax=Desulfocurvibacter africanus PCS TaxID=1262666 RepID=M5PPF4_DESAF|nr:SRPBCC family protein [Desulfocurvibacter africanus]EMG35815.1 polyketide cyclase/dehydrase family protein [Desulfocurvibacter africanus PCS]
MARARHTEFKGITAQRTVTVGKPRAEIYRFWRDLANLAFMEHLESVSVKDDKHSHWVAKGPAGKTLEWDAAIVREVENERIEWEPVQGSNMIGGGLVLFKDAPGGRGTEIQVVLMYDPPAGELGAAFAKLFGDNPSQMVREDLRRFKQLLETGEIPTINGQPHG